MIDKNKQDSVPRQNRILRAKDIIPGTPTADENLGSTDFDVPQFNLSRDLISVQRKQTVFRRKEKVPSTDALIASNQVQQQGKQQATENKLKIADFEPQIVREKRTHKVQWRPMEEMETLRDSIIAQIVARDIEHLCAGN